MAASKRINKEIEDLRKAANDHYSAGPEGTDIFKWTGECNVYFLIAMPNRAYILPIRTYSQSSVSTYFLNHFSYALPFCL